MAIMQMGPKEIVVEYRTAANRQRQIKVLAQLNQCAERKIAEILAAEGEELPKKWQEQLRKTARRSRKFPEGEATTEDDAPAPVSPADRATDRDLFEAVATLLPEAERQRPGENGVPVAPGDEDEGYTPADDVGPVPLEPDCRADAAPTVREVRRVEVPRSIPIEALLRTACRLLGSALELEPDRYRTYSCGVLDLVHALTEE